MKYDDDFGTRSCLYFTLILYTNCFKFSFILNTRVRTRCTLTKSRCIHSNVPKQYLILRYITLRYKLLVINYYKKCTCVCVTSSSSSY